MDYKTVMNVNIPPIEYNQLKGVKITRQGKSKFIDSFFRIDKLNPLSPLKLDGELISIRDSDKNDDQCVEDCWVSLTPLQFNLTDEKLYVDLKNRESELKDRKNHS